MKATPIDLNLLRALDALLQEASVTRAAARVGITTPAMSRTLSRLREAVGDPLLVRSGAELKPTPHALLLRDRIHPLVEAAVSMLQPASVPSLRTVARVLTVRASEAATAVLALPLVERARAELPAARLRFVPEGDEDVAALRTGDVDLDVGAIRLSGPEICVQTLLRDSYVAVVAKAHPLTRTKLTPARFAACDHISVSRRGKLRGPVDKELAALGLRRTVRIAVPGFRVAVEMAARSELVALVPRVVAERVSVDLKVVLLEAPVPLPKLVVGQSWSPRFNADPAHVWLRAAVKNIFDER